MPPEASFSEDVPLVEFMYPVFTSKPGGGIIGDSYLCSCVHCLLSAINFLCSVSAKFNAVHSHTVDKIVSGSHSINF